MTNAKKGYAYPSYGQGFLERLRDDFDQAYKEKNSLEQRVLLSQAEMLYPNHDTTLQMRKDFDIDYDLLTQNK